MLRRPPSRLALSDPATWAVLRGLVVLTFAAPVAPAHADAPAPSLAARTDPGAPWVAHGASIDAVAQSFGNHGLRLDASANRFFALVVTPGWHRRGGPTLALGLALHPQGRGLSGLELALVGEGRWRPPTGNHRAHAVWGALSLELGYRWVARGAQIGVMAGGRVASGAGPRVGPVLRFLLGWAV